MSERRRELPDKARGSIFFGPIRFSDWHRALREEGDGKDWKGGEDLEGSPYHFPDSPD
jgi:hypothetical protein